LLYSSKKKIAENFREWVGDILDDIIFNQSKELQNQLENQKLQSTTFQGSPEQFVQQNSKNFKKQNNF
jgi:prophage antirepressor-like protein